MRQIVIRAGDVQAIAKLGATHTADAVWEALPISGSARTWGSEIYFSIPVYLQEENAQATVSLGDLGYWPTGNAFCIFFGPTPASKGAEIRAASPVNVFGRVLGDPRAFEDVHDGDKVIVDRSEEP